MAGALPQVIGPLVARSTRLELHGLAQGRSQPRRSQPGLAASTLGIRPAGPGMRHEKIRAMPRSRRNRSWRRRR